jgi:hypothetical protein
MKKVLFFVVAAIVAVSMLGCGSPVGPDTPGADGFTSEWWMKGSIDWNQQNFFTISELDANVLTVEMPIVYALDYEFVIVNPEGLEFKYDSTVNVATDGTEFSFFPAPDSSDPNHVDNDGDKDDPGEINVSFTAIKDTYVIEVDVSDPANPIGMIYPKAGAGDATIVTPAVLADALDLNPWDNLEVGTKTYDDINYTVTFAVTTWAKSHNFGFNSLNGYLKGAGTVGVTPIDILFDQGDACILDPADDIYYGAEFDVTVTLPVVADAYVPGMNYQVEAVKTADGLSGPPFDYSAVMTAMTNGTGGGSSWGAELGEISTGVKNGNLYVRVTFTTPDAGNNLYLLLDNPAVSTGATTADLALDLTTGWGDLGISANTAGFNPDMVAWGYRSGVAFNLAGANTLVQDPTLVGTPVPEVDAVNDAVTDSTIWFEIPLASLGLTSTDNEINAVVLFGKDVAGGGIHSAIPAALMATDDAGASDNVTDILEVASSTLTIP